MQKMIARYGAFRAKAWIYGVFGSANASIHRAAQPGALPHPQQRERNRRRRRRARLRRFCRRKPQTVPIPNRNRAGAHLPGPGSMPAGGRALRRFRRHEPQTVLMPSRIRAGAPTSRDRGAWPRAGGRFGDSAGTNFKNILMLSRSQAEAPARQRPCYPVPGGERNVINLSSWRPSSRTVKGPSMLSGPSRPRGFASSLRCAARCERSCRRSGSYPRGGDERGIGLPLPE